MDPNETLKRIREEVALYNQGARLDEHNLIEHFEALDEWLSKGGALPKEWER